MPIVKFIDHRAIKRQNIPALQYLEWVEAALAMKSEALLPPKISIHPEEGMFYNVMPCVIPDAGVARGYSATGGVELTIQ